MKAIIIIGGGDLGLNTVIWAKELGLFTVVTDRNPEAPGIKEADSWTIISGDDTEAQVNLAVRLGEWYDVVGVYCANDFGLLPVAHVNQLLKVPSHPVKAVAQSLDKSRTYQILWAHNLPVPKSFKVSSLAEAKGAFIRAGVPAIVKPADSSGSQGVSIVKNSDDLITAYSEASRFGDVLIQEYIGGRSIDVNGLFIEGKFYGCGVLEKYISDPPYCLPMRGRDPAHVPEPKEAYRLLESACRALGITEGPVCADMKLVGDKFTILEISPRFHGDFTTSNTLPFATGINPVKAYFKYLMTGKLDKSYLKPFPHGIAEWRVIQLPQGIIKKISGLEEARKIKGVSKIWLRVKEGDPVGNYSNTMEIPGAVCVYGKDGEAIERIYRRVFDTLKMEVE